MKYFGTDGIRGKAIDELSIELAFKLGQALVKGLNANNIVVGFDTRKSSYALASAVSNGILSQGGNVLFAEETSTPMISYYSYLNSIYGVMITASHNPYTDNGIKVFNKGIKSNEDEEKILESFLNNKSLENITFGEFKYINVENEYKELYKNFVKTKFNIAFDSANGATYKIAPKLLNKFANNSQAFFINPNGININENCGSTHPEIIFNIVKDKKLDLGFAYDGDGDRLIVVDQKRIYDGDILIYAYAKYLHKHNLLKNNKIVLTKMSNPGIITAFKNLGIDVLLTDVGDKHVLKAIFDNDLSIGGENSGHIILNHLLHTGDGLFASIYLMQILESENKTLFEYVKEVSMYPFILENLKGVNKEILKNIDVINQINSIKDEFTDGLILVRASGTEDLVRVTVSHKNEELVKITINKIKDIILKGGIM